MGWIKNLIQDLMFENVLLEKYMGISFISRHPRKDYWKGKHSRWLFYGSEKDKMRANVTLDEARRNLWPFWKKHL